MPKKHPKRQFLVKVGTIFEDSPSPLKSWLLAVWMIATARTGFPATSWRVQAALRFDRAMQRLFRVSKDELEIRAAAHQESRKSKPRRGPKRTQK